MAKRKPREKSKVDANAVKEAAKGKWPDILRQFCPELHESIDSPPGRHVRCPLGTHEDQKPSFRLDKPSEGRAICTCGAYDGWQLLERLRGWRFTAALKEVADYLGVEGGGDGGKKSASPETHLRFQEWTDGTRHLAELWCLKHPPITVQAIEAAGGRIAKYRWKHSVIAMPIWGRSLSSLGPVGWVLISRTGRGLPRYFPDGSFEVVTKPLTAGGSLPGVLGDLSRLEGAQVVWKAEGVTDMLALLSLGDLPPDHAVITNSAGAKQRPVRWVCELATDKLALVAHDADVPGQEGALGWTDDHGRKGQQREGWATALARHAKRVKNVLLPYPIAESNGKDLRDFLAEGGGMADLRKLADQAEAVRALELKPNRADDDPHRLAQLNLERYASKTDGRTLRYWMGSWWVWKNVRYVPESEKEVRAKVVASIAEEFGRLNLVELERYRERQEAGQLEDGEKPPVARPVYNKLTAAVLAATEGMQIISGECQLNTWLPTKERRSYISMKNGILDVDAVLAGREEYLLPHSSEWFSTIHFGYEFDATAQCPTWMNFLDTCMPGDPDAQKFLQQWAGYLLLPDCQEQAFLVLEGEGGNGKSTFCAGIEAILGEEHCSHVSLEAFGDRFSKSATLGKLVNICGDAPELDNVAEGQIKDFVGGAKVNFDRKNKDAITAQPTARLMIACNSVPRLKDRSEGIWRRFFVSEWKTEIGRDIRIKGMDEPRWWVQTGELPGMFRWALYGLVMLKQEGFIEVASMEEKKEEHRLNSNPAKRFCNECLESSPGTWISCRHVYDQYERWMREMGLKGVLSSQELAKEIRRVFKNPPVETKRIGKRATRRRCFSNIDYQEDLKLSNEDLIDAYPVDF